MPIQWNESEPGIDFWVENGEHHLDVRRLLEGGGQPYPHIMACARQIGPGDTLVIQALFEPVPLTRELERMKLDWRTQREAEDHWLLRVWK